MGGQGLVRRVKPKVRRSRRSAAVFAAAIVAAVAGVLLVPSGHVQAAGDPVIAAAGDIACDPADSHFNGGNGSSGLCAQSATYGLLTQINPTAVLALGDNQYNCGGYNAFLQSYALSWGNVKSKTHPVVGNHEYIESGGTNCDSTGTAAGYFKYYGAAATGPSGKGWYSFDVGSWHLIALNSNCTQAGGCGPTSPEGKWLASDLAAHTNACTLAFWHIPLNSSGGYTATNSYQLWKQLYAAGADVILNGHAHIYERFAPQAPPASTSANAGVSDPTYGIREFIVGTGGANHTGLTTNAPNSEIKNSTTFGVLQLTLHSSSYDWKFVPIAGQTFTDSGTAACHGKPVSGTDTTAPTTPTGLTAKAVSSSEIDLSWSVSTDTGGSGLAGYKVYDGGKQIATTSSASYKNTGLAAGTTHVYTVAAYDKAGNTSPQSSSVQATTGSGSGGGSTTLTFKPTADSYVNSASASSNYGSSTALRVDGASSPVMRSYLRFALSGLSGSVTKAILKIYANSSQPSGFAVDAVSNDTWGESTINYSNAPAVGSQLATSGAVTSGAYLSIDVTSYVKGNGDIDLALAGLSTTQLSLASRESSNPPQLVVTSG